MELKAELIKLRDGRILEILIGGDANGYPVVMHHGTPGEMNVFADWHSLCLERGARLICASRPGYAESSRLPHRIVAQVAADVEAVLDMLRHEYFVTLGWSGGGPHALACASLLPNRCVAAATLGGIGAYGVDDLDFLAGMGPENVEEFGAACEGEDVIRRWMNDHASAFREITGEILAEALGGLVPDVDKTVLVGGFADRMAATFRRSLTGGFDGWIDDDLAFTSPWGFDPADIRAPVTVWQGKLDLMVPIAHGQWLLEKIPGSLGRIVNGQGHISLVTSFRQNVLDELLYSGQRGDV